LDHHEIVSNLGHLASDTTAGDHFVALLQAAEQVLVLFGTLGLRTPDHQIEDDQKANQENPLETAAGRAGSRGVSVGGGNEKAHVTLLMERILNVREISPEAAQAGRVWHRRFRQRRPMYPVR